MKPTRRINDPYHNPFHNRFHEPVHSRIDEMQALTHMTWLNEPAALDHNEDQNQTSRHWTRALTSAFAGAFALLVFALFSARLLLN